MKRPTPRGDVQLNRFVDDGMKFVTVTKSASQNDEKKQPEPKGESAHKKVAKPPSQINVKAKGKLKRAGRNGTRP